LICAAKEAGKNLLHKYSIIANEPLIFSIVSIFGFDTLKKAVVANAFGIEPLLSMFQRKTHFLMACSVFLSRISAIIKGERESFLEWINGKSLNLPAQFLHQDRVNHSPIS
jgi:hypothetical protein